MRFNEKLQKLRKENQMSQEQLADILDVSRQAVSKWESGTTYPEMDKLLTMCKIFKCSLDDLTNDEISDITVTETKKNNISNWFDMLLNGINNTMRMFSYMRSRDFIKMFVYMSIVFIILMLLFIPITILINLGNNIFEIFGEKIEIVLSRLWLFILSVLYLIFSTTIFIYVFKKKYLEPYNNAITENEENIIIKKSSRNGEEREIKIKTIYKDINTVSLGWIGKLFTYMFKFINCLVLMPFLISFVGLFLVFIIMLVLLFKGVSYIGILLAIIFSILANYVIIEILIKLIFSVTLNFKKLFIMFIIAIVGLGITSGLVIIEIAGTSYSNKTPDYFQTISISQEFDFNENIYINNPHLYDPYWSYNQINYIENNEYSDTMKVEVIYYDIYNSPSIYLDSDSYLHILTEQNFTDWNLIIESIIKDLKNKKIHNYLKLNEIKINIYSSKQNIEVLKNNSLEIHKRYIDENEQYTEFITELQDIIANQAIVISELETNYYETLDKLDILQNEFNEYKSSINEIIISN